MKAGTFVKGIFKAMKPEQYLAPQALSVHNQVYELRITAQPIAARFEQAIVEGIMNMNIPGATVLAAEAKGSSVKLQVRANQFQWAALFAFIPTIIGPIIALIVGIIFIFAVPSWAWAAIPLGIGGAVIAYAVLKAKPTRKRKVKKQ